MISRSWRRGRLGIDTCIDTITNTAIRNGCHAQSNSAPFKRALLPARPLLDSLTRSCPQLSKQQYRCSSTAIASSDEALNANFPNHDASSTSLAGLLHACPGCGALAQTVEHGQAGYYSAQRKAVQTFVTASAAQHSLLENEDSETQSPLIDQSNLPLCDRCHELLHHNLGSPISHPTIQSLSDTIAESPYTHHHIYHVLDAADFPMSLFPKIHSALGAAFQRSKNRRAQHAGFRGGRKVELSFIITRSDLLAPTKEQVDAMMPYLVSQLRYAIGPSAERVRLGNVYCVSAQRGWWTKKVKLDIWRRGGAGWLVGKVNVGKSKLFEVAFPKNGAGESESSEPSHTKTEPTSRPKASALQQSKTGALLPPARQESPFPTMPTASTLPGTTASPIRIPFDNGRGELIDLPGLERSDIAQFVQPEFHNQLIMTDRVKAGKRVIKSTQSLLLGGLVRITSLEPEEVNIEAYPFTNIRAHVSSTEKAIEFESDSTSIVPRRIIKDGVEQSIKSAGIFELKFKVTEKRAGPLGKLPSKKLPFIIYSADILIESVGWVELVAQVRKKRVSQPPEGMDYEDWDPEQCKDEPTHIPRVEVFTPNGSYVGLRAPMNAGLIGGLDAKPLPRSKRKQRPRQSMSNERRLPQK